MNYNIKHIKIIIIKNMMNYKKNQSSSNDEITNTKTNNEFNRLINLNV